MNHDKEALGADLDALMKKHNLDGYMFFGMQDVGDRMAVAFVVKVSDLDCDADQLIHDTLTTAAERHTDRAAAPKKPIAQA